MNPKVKFFKSKIVEALEKEIDKYSKENNYEVVQAQFHVVSPSQGHPEFTVMVVFGRAEDRIEGE